MHIDCDNAKLRSVFLKISRSSDTPDLFGSEKCSLQKVLDKLLFTFDKVRQRPSACFAFKGFAEVLILTDQP